MLLVMGRLKEQALSLRVISRTAKSCHSELTATPPPSGSRMPRSWQLCAGSNNLSLTPEIRDLLWQLLTWGAYYLSCDTETWKLRPYLLFQNHSSKMGGSPIASFLPTWLHFEKQFSHECTWLVEPKLHTLFLQRSNRASGFEASIIKEGTL